MKLQVSISHVLWKSLDFLKDLQGGGEIVTQGEGFGAMNDTEIHADKKLGEFFSAELLKLDDVKWVQVEGEKVQENPGFKGKVPLTAYVDPLDGSLNYRQANAIKGLRLCPVPYAAVITLVVGEPGSQRFGDIVAAGIMDLRSGDIVVAAKGVATTLNGYPVAPSADAEVDLTSQIYVGESYYDPNRKLLTKIFDGQNGYLRSFGSAAWEMILPAIGMTHGFVCLTQKAHESGAAYLINKNAGCAILPIDDSTPYLFNEKNPVVIGCSVGVAEELAKRAGLKV